jgi:hypothetical protein
MDEITQGDLDEFRLVLIGQKYQDRSIGNILGNLHCFLIKLDFMVDAKLAKRLPGKLVPVRHQVPKKAPKQYNGDLHALMAASTPEDRELWDFLRKSGFPEDEAAHVEITDVEAQQKNHIEVVIKPCLHFLGGVFYPKKKKERSVLIPVDLVKTLRKR